MITVRTSPVSVILAILLALAFVGRSTPVPSPAGSSGDQPTAGAGSSAAKTATPAKPASAVDYLPQSGTYVQELTLPGGTILRGGEAQPYRGRNVSLSLETVGVNAARPDWWVEAVGNHAEVGVPEEVTLASGQSALHPDPATLVLVKRTPPAAAGQAPATWEYWLMVPRGNPERKDLKTVYAIVAQVSGDPGAARQEVLALARGWHLPES